MDEILMEMAYDMLFDPSGYQTSVQEAGATGDAIGISFGKDIKEAKKFIKEGKKFAKNGDKTNANKSYDKAIKILEDLKSRARKMDDDTFSDKFIQWFFTGLLGVAILAGYAGEFKGTTREAVLRSLDSTIDTVKRLKNK